jgi:hypothetical protein
VSVGVLVLCCTLVFCVWMRVSRAHAGSTSRGVCVPLHCPLCTAAFNTICMVWSKMRRVVMPNSQASPPPPSPLPFSRLQLPPTPHPQWRAHNDAVHAQHDTCCCRRVLS